MKHFRLFISVLLLLSTLSAPAVYASETDAALSDADSPTTETAETEATQAESVETEAAEDPFASVEKPVIILDPGHGGVDAGTTAGIRYEKTYNLIIAQHLRELLLEHGGFEVYLTRETDVYLKFLPRALLIPEYNADLLLSLHCNSSTVDYANGVLAITSVIEPYSAWALGESILSNLSSATGMRNKGVETSLDTGDSLGVYYWNSEKNWDMPGASYLKTVSDYYSMNTWSSKFGVPSLIVEHGYLSNANDRAIIDKEENLLKIAEAEAKALIAYYYGHTHVYTAEKVVDYPASCSIAGSKSYHCTICGIKKDTEALPIDPNAHFYRQIGSKLATCDEDGYIEYICQISYNLNDKGYTTPVHTYTEVLPKKEAHDYQKSAETPPTCTTDGAVTYTCSRCGASYNDPIPATGHSLNADGVCSVCGFGAPAETTPIVNQAPATHVFEEYDRVEPTCESEGEIRSRCSLCGEEHTEPIAALGHDYIVSLNTTATCTQLGYYRARCHICGKEIVETRPMIDHNYVTEEENDEGITSVCTVCGHKITEAREDRGASELILPLFLIILALIVGQVVLLIVINRRRHRRRRYTAPSAKER